MHMVLLIVLCVYMCVCTWGVEVIGNPERRIKREREARLGYCVLTSIKFVKAWVVMQNHCGTRLHCTRLPSSHRLRAFPPTRA